MHELGVTLHILDHVEGVAAANNVTRVSKVVLELGEVSTVIGSYTFTAAGSGVGVRKDQFSKTIVNLRWRSSPAITCCELREDLWNGGVWKDLSVLWE